jgi:glycine cleavage system regulatory protein
MKQMNVAIHMHVPMAGAIGRMNDEMTAIAMTLRITFSVVV